MRHVQPYSVEMMAVIVFLNYFPDSFVPNFTMVHQFLVLFH